MWLAMSKSTYTICCHSLETALTGTWSNPTFNLAVDTVLDSLVIIDDIQFTDNDNRVIINYSLKE